MIRFPKTGLVAGLALALAATPALAEWPEKPITFVVGYSPGGGFDTIARALAPEMEKILGTDVVVENIPGAGGQKGGATIYRADPDGYTIGIWNIPGLTVPQLLGEDVGYDLTDVTWLANIGTSRYALAVRSDSEYTSLEQLCTKGDPMKLSDTGPASTSSVTAVIAMSLIDCPIVNVTGYKGSTDTIIGAIRGEVDATIKPISTLSKYVESGDMKILLTFEDEPSLEGVPSSTEAGYPEFASFDLRRVVGGPPGMADDVAARLSEALVQATQSESFQEWANSTAFEVEAMGQEETEQMMSDLMEFYSKYTDVLAN